MVFHSSLHLYIRTNFVGMFPEYVGPAVTKYLDSDISEFILNHDFQSVIHQIQLITKRFIFVRNPELCYKVTPSKNLTSIN